MHTAPGTGSGVGACAGVCETHYAGNDPVMAPPRGRNTNMGLLNRLFKYFACCNVLKVGAKGRTMLQETLSGVLDHRTTPAGTKSA